VTFIEENGNTFDVIDSPMSIDMVKNVFDDINNFLVLHKMIQFGKAVGLGWSQIPYSWHAADFSSTAIVVSPFQEFFYNVQSLKVACQQSFIFIKNMNKFLAQVPILGIS